MQKNEKGPLSHQKIKCSFLDGLPENWQKTSRRQVEDYQKSSRGPAEDFQKTTRPSAEQSEQKTLTNIQKNEKGPPSY